MTPLEKKRIKTEILQVQAGRAGLELRIEEMAEEINKLKKHIEISSLKEQELINKLGQEA